MKYNFNRTPNLRHNGSRRWLQDINARNGQVIGMGTADLDFQCPPCIQKALQETAEETLFNYRITPDTYYDSMIDFFSRRYGFDIDNDWITGLPGTLPTIRLLLMKFTSPGDRVIMQSPFFNPLKTIVEGSGCELIENPMRLTGTRYELDYEDFEDRIREQRPSVFILVNPQNPTGRVFTREELETLVYICDKYNVLIISDEVHFLVTYDGRKHIPLPALSERARRRSILVFSMSKGFNIMGLTHAITIIPDPDLQASWKEFLRPFDFHYVMNAFSVAGITAAFSREAEEWLGELTEYLQKNRDLLMRELSDPYLPLEPVCPEASFLMWLDCRNSGIDPSALHKVFIDQAGISLDNGLEHGQAGSGFVRINFAVSRRTLSDAIERIKGLFH